ncbi:MAG TPA: helix-turn-helix transcriptional regulator [Candidatus Microsaccharimonas sp.]|nr:helix-turn-helix transcriptional regulator [Candidatus Microsaccharimonas sp.]
MNEQKSQGGNASNPFKMLGDHLKYLREQLKESLIEVSGAVEIDMDDLARIEQGVERPSEDILLLLIQHYDMHDQEAVQLWELAGYDGNESPHKIKLENNPAAMLQNKQMVMLLAMDVRTMYSDGVDININPAGVTMSFSQTTGDNQRVPVGRIGMSYEQATLVVKTLEQALLRAKYLGSQHRLPGPESTS